MLNSFDTNIRILVDESVSDALVNLETIDLDYKRKSQRISGIYETLNELLNENPKNISNSHWNIVKEYLDLELEIGTDTHMAIYFKAIIDFLKILAALGMF